jgi:hypothetical protein
MRAIMLLLSAVFLGVGGGYAWSTWSKAAPQLAAARPAAPAGQQETAGEVEQSVDYASCAAVRDAGKAPLFPGQPGYSKALDTDGDGVACPPDSAG